MKGRQIMSKCKSCGAEIIWIKTAAGKSMPCNPQKISFRNDWSENGLTLITPDGKIAKGTLDLDSDTYGYESHFATCPAAAIHRKRNN